MGVVLRKKLLSCVLFLVVFLLPALIPAFSIDRNLGTGEFYSVYREANVGWRIEGSFSTNNNVEFFICDEGNYTNWKKHQSVLLQEHNESTTGQTFNFTIPYDSTWHVVFYNSKSQGSNNLEAELYFIDQFDIVQTEVAWISQTRLWTPTTIGLLFVAPVLCLLVVWISRRSEEIPAVNYDEILPKPN
ncbi:MAG: hypothetical protein ACFFFK_11775 [Candidatus Thorarchaeota archaeon]